MDNNERLSHTAWDCKYHVVFIPKCHRKTLYGTLRKYLGEVFHQLARQRESRVLEGHLMPDHVHILISVPPKYSVSQVAGYVGARVRFILPVHRERDGAILWGSTSGREVTRPGGHAGFALGDRPEPRRQRTCARCRHRRSFARRQWFVDVAVEYVVLDSGVVLTVRSGT